MVKKVFLFTALVVFLLAASVSAFDLVEEKPQTGLIGIGVEDGFAWGPDYHALFSGIAGNYNFDQKFGVKLSVGKFSASSDEKGFYASVKPEYYLVNKYDTGLYVFGVLSNLTPRLVSVGAGIGIEYNIINGMFRTVGELSYSFDQILSGSCGLKLYF